MAKGPFLSDIARAVELQRQGTLSEAESIYRRVLESEPSHTRALKLLGALLGQSSRTREAVEVLQEAIAADERSAETHCNLAHALRIEGKIDESAQHYRRAAELDPQLGEAQLAIAQLLHSRGQASDALAYYRGAAQFGKRRAAVLGLAAAYSDLGEWDAASECLIDELSIAPQDAALHDALAGVLKTQGDFEQSADHLRRAAKLKPGDITILVNLASTLRVLGRLEEALAVTTEAIELDPKRPGPLVNAATIYQELGDYDHAMRYCRRALSLDASYAPARINQALLLLLTENFSEGWREYRWRWRAPSIDFRPQDRLDLPFWDGGDLAERAIFVHAEQGVGDDVMFATCLPDLIDRAGHCIVECDLRLVPLFERSFPQATIQGTKGSQRLGESAELARIDCHIPAGCLPRHLRPDVEAFPRRRRVLVADAANQTRWQSRYHQLGRGLKVGISWRGGGDANEQRRRSTSLVDWADVLRVPDVQFVNLQYGACADELAGMHNRLGITVHDWDDADPLNDLDDFAAQVAALDLVISITNATVHMAGALGVTTWTLLPYASTWRWFAQRDDSLWYPSVRVMRQRKGENWNGMFARVAGQLRALVASRVAAQRNARFDAPQHGGEPHHMSPHRSNVTRAGARPGAKRTEAGE